MINRCEQLYQELLNDLRYCQEKGLPFLVETEYCFYLSEKYRGLLRDELTGYIFHSIEEEVHFFKNINPKFIAESEYASLLNYAGNFCPETTYLADIQHFWLRQASRLEKFKKEHKEFYAYYLEGHTHLDTVYYTRASQLPGEPDFYRTSNDYDLLTGRLLAQERYVVYAGKQLEALREKKGNGQAL